MTIFITPSFRDGIHRRDNRYRFNKERGCWQFDDGVGPWTNITVNGFEGKNDIEGERFLTEQGFVKE